jgi:hypothetical protein
LVPNVCDFPANQYLLINISYLPVSFLDFVWINKTNDGDKRIVNCLLRTKIVKNKGFSLEAFSE